LKELKKAGCLELVALGQPLALGADLAESSSHQEWEIVGE
jgi:hypothetical protein